MGIGDSIILGLIQGLTEFLPVSSSGHLVLGKTLLGIPEQDILFEVFVHFGTLLAVITAFRSDFVLLVRTFFSLFHKNSLSTFGNRFTNDDGFRLMIFIILATLPAVVVGLFFEDSITAAFNDPRLVCVMLILTAIILFSTLFKPKADKELNTVNSIIMGFAQALAIFPGISRSGSTISFGMFFKLDGEKAARFSFLLSIPAILGATILKSVDMFSTGLDQQTVINLIVGTIVSYISGYLAIESLLKIVRKGKLYWFAPYCLTIGILGLLFL